MQTKLKQRLVGAGVFFVVILLFMPVLLYNAFRSPLKTSIKPLSISSISSSHTQQPKVHTVALNQTGIASATLAREQNPPQNTHQKMTTPSSVQPAPAASQATPATNQVSAAADGTPQTTSKTDQTELAVKPSAAVPTATTATVSKVQSVNKNSSVVTLAQSLKKKVLVPISTVKAVPRVRKQKIQAANTKARASLFKNTSLVPISAVFPKASPRKQLIKAVRVRSPQVTSLDRITALNKLSAGMDTPKAWVIQLGSFGNVNNARALLLRLRRQGYHAFTKRVGAGVTQVFVGPEVRSSAIQKLQKTLKARFKLTGLVRQYRA